MGVYRMMIIENLCKKVRNENNERIYFYRSFNEEYRGRQAYGVEIERHDLENGSLIRIERDSISKVTIFEDKIKDILNLIYDNNVSPIHLVDIIGEYVDNNVFEFNF